MESESSKRTESLFFQALQQKDLAPEEFVRNAAEYESEEKSRVLALLEASSNRTRWLRSNIVADVLDADPDFFDEAWGDDTVPDSEPFSTGEVCGNFRILGKLGSGGMSVVYEAIQLRPVERRVAIKIIRPSQLNETAIRRFQKEIKALAKLSHPNIATIFEVGEFQFEERNQSWLFASMELIEGSNLTEYSKSRPESKNWQELIRLAIELCEAVSFSHRHGLYHRDIKPGNVLIQTKPRPHVKLIDFGIVKSENTFQEDHQTQTGHLVGSPRYMSPEQLMGKTIDARSDIYSTGLVLYEMFSHCREIASLREGQTEGVEVWARKTKQAFDSSPALSDCPARIREKLVRVICKALQPNRDHRYGEMANLRDDLEAILNRKPLSLPNPPWYQGAATWLKDHVFLTMAVLAVIVIASGIGFKLWGPAPADSKSESRKTNQQQRVAANELILSLCAEDDFDAHRYKFGESLVPMYESQKRELELNPESGSDSQGSVFVILAILYSNRNDFDKADTCIRTAQQYDLPAKYQKVIRKIYAGFLETAARRLSEEKNVAHRDRWKVIHARCQVFLDRPVELTGLSRVVSRIESEQGVSLPTLVARTTLARAALQSPNPDLILEGDAQVALKQLMRSTYLRYRLQTDIIGTERGYNEFLWLLNELQKEQNELFRHAYRDHAAKRYFELNQSTSSKDSSGDDQP